MVDLRRETYDTVDPTLLRYHLWVFPIAGYFLYLTIFLIGFFLGITAFNIAGAIIFFVLLLIGNYKQALFIRKDLTVNIAFWMMFIPIINLVLRHQSTDISYIIKHVMLYATYVVVLSYGLPPLYSRYEKKYLLLMLFAVMAVSLLSGRSFVRDEEVRLSGVFTDPNNLALMALAFLFFVDEEVDSIAKKLAVYGFVFVVLIVTATSGAMLAFMVGMAYKFRKRLLNGKILLFSVLTSVVLLFFAPDLMNLQSVMRLYTQMDVAVDNIHLIKEQSDLDFGTLVGEHSQTSLSGLWRLFHWTKAVLLYIGSAPLVILFGFGIGTSSELLGNVPHNEYVRVLFEQGLVGFVLFIMFYSIVLKRIDKRYVHIMIMIAVFSVTQNVIENMLFMNIFILYIATTQIPRYVADAEPSTLHAC